jgi:hypothetical protein
MRYFILTMLSVLLLSCNRDEEDAKQGPKEVIFYQEQTQTRANEVLDFEDGDAIGIYVLDKSSNATLQPVGNYADNKKYVFNSTKKAFVAADLDNLIFNSPDRRLEFYVYYPWYSQITDATALLHVVKGTGREDDFLYAVNSDMDGSQYIPLSFRHLLSKVNVKYTATENRENAQISVHTYTDTKINLAMGEVTTISNKRVDLPLEKVSLPDQLCFKGVIVPQTWKANEKFSTLTYSGGASHPFSFAEDRTFASGEENEVYFMPKMPAYDFTVSPTTLSVPALDKSAHPFVVTSQKSDAINGVKLPNTTVDIAYDLTSKPDWATVANGNIVFSENRVTTPRTGTITFTQTESNLTTSIDVQQDAGVITNNYTFALNDGSATASWTGVAAKGATNTYTIVSIKDIIVNGVKDKSENMSYTASSNANWITVSGSTLTVAENRVASARAGTVTFTQAESGKKITVTVQQVAGIITNDYKFTLSDGSITTSWTGIGAGATSKNFAIVSNKDIIINGTKDRTEDVSYSASSSAGWITVSGSTISVSENRGAARTGTVTFTQAESGKKITVTVQQVAGVVSYNYKFTLNDGSTSASWTGVSASGSSKGYSIVSNKDVLINGTKDRTENVSYSASSSAGWITVSGSTISVSENRGAARTGTVTFTQAESGKKITVTVQQVAGVVSYNYKFTLNDGSTSASWTGVSASGSSKGYSIVSNKDVLINGTKDRTENVSYSASSSAGWITVSGSTISVSENRGGARSGTVTFTQAESGKKITVTVQQSAGVITSNYTFSLSDGSTSASWTSISSSGDSKSYSINSSKDILINGVKDRTENVGYTASSNVSWITVSGSTVTVQENMSTTPRGGVVTFTQSESGKTIKITLLQLKKSSVDIE